MDKPAVLVQYISLSSISESSLAELEIIINSSPSLVKFFSCYKRTFPHLLEKIDCWPSVQLSAYFNMIRSKVLSKPPSVLAVPEVASRNFVLASGIETYYRAAFPYLVICPSFGHEQIFLTVLTSRYSGVGLGFLYFPIQTS